MKDTEEITRVGEELGAAILAYDVEGMARAYAPDAVIMPPGAPEVVGGDAIRAWFQGAVDRFRFEEYRVTTSELVTHGDWALRRGGMFWRLMPKTGGEPTVLDTKFLQLWQRQSDDSWRIFRGIWNDNKSPG
jgi:ketosteroid isomerase-like protein